MWSIMTQMFKQSQAFMPLTVMQFAGEGIWGNIVWFLLFMVFIFFYPRLMIAQMLWRLEQTAELIEGWSAKAKGIVTKRISRRPDRKLKQAVANFTEFFMIQPVSLDPYGIIKKLEHVVNLSEQRFEWFVDNVAPKLDSETKANIRMGLSGAISLNQVAKLVRHFVELIRKTKNLQLALVLQMQLPLIERISKALLYGTEALTNGWPIGDSIGSLIAARMIGTSKVKQIEKDTVLAKKHISGRDVLILKAKGPGGRVGKLGPAVEKLVKKHKIVKIITIDAAAKLEGEKTGSVAEGVGVAMGGIGVDRAYIENIAVKRRIPLDSVVIKMSQEEAIQPMAPETLAAADRVIRIVEKNIANTRAKGLILVVGVGNSCGVGNDAAAAEKAERLAKKVMRIVKARKEKEKRRRLSWLWGGYSI